mmetsp:Transcript_6766/g.19511  ORF Transcript_6766/g.19511 Transcript_6766/m.19511 type:complete len:277 (+) Transcript_6766:1079-1909(+)
MVGCAVGSAGGTAVSGGGTATSGAGAGEGSSAGVGASELGAPTLSSGASLSSGALPESSGDPASSGAPEPLSELLAGGDACSRCRRCHNRPPANPPWMPPATDGRDFASETAVRSDRLKAAAVLLIRHTATQHASSPRQCMRPYVLCALPVACARACNAAPIPVQSRIWCSGLVGCAINAQLLAVRRKYVGVWPQGRLSDARDLLEIVRSQRREVQVWARSCENPQYLRIKGSAEPRMQRSTTVKCRRTSDADVKTLSFRRTRKDATWGAPMGNQT